MQMVQNSLTNWNVWIIWVNTENCSEKSAWLACFYDSTRQQMIIDPNNWYG